MRDNAAALTGAGIQVVGISPDAVDVLEKFSGESSLGFPLLSDADSATIKAFGIHNQKGLPHPGTFVVDREGVIRSKMFIEGYRERTPVEQLLEAVTELSGEQDSP